MVSCVRRLMAGWPAAVRSTTSIWRSSRDLEARPRRGADGGEPGKQATQISMKMTSVSVIHRAYVETCKSLALKK